MLVMAVRRGSEKSRVVSLSSCPPEFRWARYIKSNPLKTKFLSDQMLDVGHIETSESDCKNSFRSSPLR